MPIKYLFIPSIQQDENIMNAKDFQNLIGRVGRAGKFTEGSIVFTDPAINLTNLYWQSKIRYLLDAENGDAFSTALLDIFSPLMNIVGVSFVDIIDLYYEAKADASKAADLLHNGFPTANIDMLSKELTTRFQAIEKVESLLMMAGETFCETTAIEIARASLSYCIASDEQKDDIEKLFKTIAAKIQKVVAKNKIQAYAKTMYGLYKTMDLESILSERKDLLLAAFTYSELLDALWDIFIAGYVRNKSFNSYNDKDKLKAACHNWLDGASFSELFGMLEGGKIGNRKLKIETCVEIFETAMSYDGANLINAIMELIINTDSAEYKGLAESLQLFQKQIKYGLPTRVAIDIYELGFCDRVIAQELEKIVRIAPNMQTVKEALTDKKEDVRSALQKYPAYYGHVLECLL